MPTSKTRPTSKSRPAVKIPKIAEYTKNVGKSVAFASINAVKSNMPGLQGFTEDNHEVFVSVYSNLKDIKGAMRKANKSIKDSDLYKAIEYGAKNMIEDAKTGNFYNDRSSEISDQALGLDDFGDFDFNYEVSSGEPSGTSKKSTEDVFNSIIKESTIGTTTAVAHGTDMVIKSNKASATIISGQIEKSTATLHSGLGAVYNSIGAVNAFLNGPMLAHLNNSKTYYENSLKIMQEQQAMMKEMLEMQRNLYVPQMRRANESSLDQSFNSNGYLDLKGYSKNIKKNIENLMGPLTMMSGTGVNMPLIIAAQPFKILLDTMAENLMPKNIKKSLNMFDKSIAGLFGQFIGKANKNRNNYSSSLIQLLGDIFGINIEKKTTIDTANYNKGPVPFDGITRKTIIEVIPGYLARIESALTGAGERHYNARSGKWISARQMKDDWEKERISAIESANRGITNDIRKSGLDSTTMKIIEESVRKMKEQIFEDGYFDPKITENKKVGNKYSRKSNDEAYKKYGFKSKKQFEAVLSMLSEETMMDLALSNMKAKESYSRRIKQYEEDGGYLNNLFNGAYDDKSNKTGNSKISAGQGLLALSHDNEGHNVFYYLKEILYSIDRRHRNRNTKNNKKNYRSSNTTNRSGSNRESTTKSEKSEDDSGSDDSDSDKWEQAIYEQDELEKKKIEDEAKKNAAKKWVNDSVGKSSVGKYFKKIMNGASTILSSPMKFATDLLEKANSSLFRLMFGDAKQVGDKKVDNIFDYITAQIKDSFESIKKSIVDAFNKMMKPHLDWFKEKINKYLSPVWSEIKNVAGAAKRRVGKAFKNTFGRAAGTVMDNLPPEVAERVNNGDVVTADEIEDESYEEYVSSRRHDEYFGDGLETSARGRIARKRGLTMISPGEIIIPASFNKKKQNKMLRAEKRDRNRILNAIGLNAAGSNTAEVEEMKRKLQAIYNENKNTKNAGAKIGAGGAIGGVLGLLGIGNPLLGALAGAGIAVMNNSATMQKIVFGEDIVDENGNVTHKNGIISKKIQDTFKKYGSDMTDYGIAGGVLGLLTPFGVLGGAAIGAGVGFLKNNESFKKFIFGENGDGEDGLMSRETYDKFKEHVKKAAPKMVLGAGLGILGGPFGILGNAALGAGVGLLTETETFHTFLYGDGEDKNGGLIGAFKTGFLEPAQEKFLEFVDDFKNFAKKSILEPMKDFWDPIKNRLKNMITGIGERIADNINDKFEKWVGLPLHDFLQEKVFRPMSKLIGGFVKLPYNLAKGAISLPFKAMRGIGNSVRARDIRRGAAYDMSASERLAWRDKHNIRFSNLNSWRDKTREDDELLAGLTAAGDYDRIEELASLSRASLTSHAQLQRNVKSARKALSDDISAYFNANGDNESKNRFTRAGYNQVNKLTEVAQTEGYDEANKIIKKMNLTDKEKDEIREIIKNKIGDVDAANDAMKKGNMSNSELDEALTKILGHKVKGRSGRRYIMKSAEAELKHRNKAEESPETAATNNFAEIYKAKADRIIGEFAKLNETLSAAISGKKDTKSDSDKAAEIAKTINGNADADSSNAEVKNEVDMKKNIKDHISKVNKKSAKPVTTALTPITGEVSNIDPDSKEATEQRKKDEETRGLFKNFFKNNDKSTSLLEDIKTSLVGNKKKDKDKKEGWLSKIWGGAKKVGKFLGITGLALTGLSLFGHATQWFKTSIWPMMKTTLFGTKDADGNVVKEGLVSSVGNKIKTVLLGQDGYGGIIGGIRLLLFGRRDEYGEWQEHGLVGNLLIGIKRILFGEKDENGNRTKNGLLSPIIDIFNGVKDYISGRGLKNFFLEDLVPKFLVGIKYAIDNVGAPLFGILLKAAPSLLASLGKAILEGLKISLFNKKLKKNGTNVKISDGGASDLISNSLKSSNSATSGAMGNDLYSKTKNAMESFFNSTSSGMTSTNEIDINAIFNDNEVKNEEKGNLIAGALGQKKRTNELVYDEEGNIISDYVQNNTTDSIGSRIWDASKKGLWNGIVGLRGTKGAAEAAVNVAKSGGSALLNVLKPGVKNKFGAIKNGFSAIFNGGKAATNGATNLGNKINKLLVGKADNVAGEVVENAVKNSSDDIVEGIAKKAAKEATEAVAENAAKDGIKSGIKGIFKNIAESGLAKKIAKFVSKDTTEAVVKKAIEKIGSKLSDNVVGKLAKGALNKIGGVIAKFSPAAIVTLIWDFWRGYDNAYTILGVANIEGGYNVSFGQKCVCGFLNLISENLTLGLVPPELIIDICVDALFPIFGLDTSSLDKARDEAGNAMEQWNLEHPDQTFDNLEDFNNKDKLWYKAKEKIKDAGSSVWNFVTGKNKKEKNTTNTRSGNGRTNELLAGKGRRFLYGKAKNDLLSISKKVSDLKLEKWNREHGNDTYNNLEEFASYSTLDKAMNAVKSASKNIVSGSIKATKSLYKGINKNITQVLKGDVDALNTNIDTNSSSIDSLSAYTANNAFDIVKLYTNPIGSLVSSFTTISKEIKAMFGKRSSAKNTSRIDSTKITNAMNGKTDVMSSSTYWTTASQTKNGLLGYMEEMRINLEKIITAPIAITTQIANKIKTSLTALKSKFGSNFKSIWSWVQGFFTTSGNGRTTTSSTVGRGRFVGKAHNYQSGALANMPYGDSTIGEAGCAPVAAANLLGGSVMDAANYAESHGFTVPGGGTDMNFFNSYLENKGIPTRNTNSRTSVMNALKNGNQVIMFGRDNYDYGAPFGTTPHYITAKGLSRNGNIIAEDPDLPYSMVEYNPNDVMNSMVSSVVAGKGRRRGKGRAELDMLNEYSVSSGYWSVRHPEKKDETKYHRALDLTKPENSPVYSFTNGTVVNTGYEAGGFGNFVSVKDNNGAWHTYAHLNKISVSKGQVLNRGDQIGLLGNTGYSTGPHLHYQIGVSDLGYGTPRHIPNEYLESYSSTSSGGSSGGSSSSGSSGSSSGSSSNSNSSGTSQTSTKSKNLMSALTDLGKSMVKALFGANAYNALYGADEANSSGGYSDDYGEGNNSSSGSSVGSSGGGNSNSTTNPGDSMSSEMARKYYPIWTTLKSMGYSDAGIAAIMGNMNAESAYRSNNLNDGVERTTSWTDASYTDAVNKKTYSKSSFINDGYAYGLNQFAFNKYKQRLYEYTIDRGKTIDNTTEQLNTLNDSLTSGLKSYLQSTNDVEAATEKFMHQYENPGKDAEDASRASRYKFAWQAYNAYTRDFPTVSNPNRGSSSSSNSRVIKPGANKNKAGTDAIMVAKGRNYGAAAKALNDTRAKYYGRGRYVGMGSAQSVDYVTFLTTIVQVLINISDNTAKLNKIIEILSKNFDIKLDSQEISKEAKNNSRAEAERALHDLINSRTNTSEYSRIINNKDTNYLVAAMSAIASE